MRKFMRREDVLQVAEVHASYTQGYIRDLLDATQAYYDLLENPPVGLGLAPRDLLVKDEPIQVDNPKEDEERRRWLLKERKLVRRMRELVEIIDRRSSV